MPELQIEDQNWPEGIEELGAFLRGNGLCFQRQGIVPQTHDILWQYGNDKVAVRVLADRGDVWGAHVADIAGWPQEWYSATELHEFITGQPVDDVSVEKQMKMIQTDWLSIVAAFTPENRERSHASLKFVRTQWAKRNWRI